MNTKNIVHSKMRNELERAVTTWNEMGPAMNSHTHTHTNHRRVLCVQYYCPKEYNITRCVIRNM